MSMFNRSGQDVDRQQLDNVQAATGGARAGWTAGRGSRSIGASRPEVRTTSGASRTVRPTPRH